MDNLQAQHAFDQIEMHLEVVKNDVLSRVGDPNQISDLEEKVEELKSDLWDKEIEFDNLKSGVEEAIGFLEEITEDNYKDRIPEIISHLNKHI